MEKHIKKKKTVMASNDAGTLFYAAMAKPDPSMDLVAKMFSEIQKSEVESEEHQAKEEGHHLKVEAAAEECCLTVKEHAQHM